MKKVSEEANAYYDKKPEKMNVYDASEGVKGITPKQVSESHKACSPGEFGINKEGALAFGRLITANLFNKGAQMARTTQMNKNAYTPSATYPYSPSPAAHPEYTPNTPPVSFQGQKVEADIPPKTFPGADHPMDNDDLFGVFQRQQSGQGLTRMPRSGMMPDAERARDIQSVNADNARGANQRNIFSRATGGIGSMKTPPVLPEGAARPPVVQPPRGLGSAAVMGKAGAAFLFGQKVAQAMKNGK